MIGIDIVVINRIDKMIKKFGDKALKKFLEYKEEQGERVLPHHIDKLTTHGFRNNFIVAVYRATNNDLVRTKRIIHHSDIKMTERYIEKYLASIPITPM